ncbi:YdcF family protein [Elusimicrobiota bacterium]
MLIVSGILLIRKNMRKTGIFSISLGLCMWVISIGPFSYFLYKGLESKYEIPKDLKGDVIIVLGGGIVNEVPDLSGSGRPTCGMYSRIVTAVRLQKIMGISLIVSGGEVYKGGGVESLIYKRFLIDLGVDENKIIIEDRSRDTYENAKYTKVICLDRGFERPIVLTDAHHMKRSLLAFKKVGMDVIPFPASFNISDNQKFIWPDFFPSSGGFDTVSRALYEYMGILFYSLFY